MLEDPVDVARLFCSALLDPVTNLDVLEMIVAPETRAIWGDFVPTADTVKAEGFEGIWNEETRAHGDRTIAYVPLLSKDDMGKTEAGFQIVLGVLSLVWREDLGRWAVFALGEPALPETAPRQP